MAQQDGYVYLSNGASNIISKYTNAGSYVTQWGVSSYNQRLECYNTGYVHLYRRYAIDRFTPTGSLDTTIGNGQGSGNGQFSGDTVGIAIYDGYIYVAVLFPGGIEPFLSEP